MSSRNRRDAVRGMFLGLALGDALGAPHEFRNQVSLSKYTGVLIFPLITRSRYQGVKVGNIGQITDDTEMTIVLAEVIAGQEGHYDEECAILAYERWANSGCYFMGKNTRTLFKGVKTIPGYEKRKKKLLEEDPSKYSASNGCLMRCSPLSLLPEGEYLEAVETDCSLSNFPDVCVESVKAYVCALREMLNGSSREEAIVRAIDITTLDEVRDIILDGSNFVARNVKENKGWILHSLYCAFFALSREGSFQDRIDEIIRMGGDTDTNGAIAGALIGAELGSKRMTKESRTGDNIDILLSYDPRTGDLHKVPDYSVERLMELAHILA
jgi:ADP-ribosyl-[dinitrogen reductase] hydrolase